MKRISSRAIGAGLAVATIALLVGFHGASSVLTFTSFGADRNSHAKPERHGSLRPDGGAVKPAPPPAATPAPQAPSSDATAQPEQPAAVAPPDASGVAAAARAKALAEIDAMERQGISLDQVDAPPETPRRSYRAPRVDKHRVY